MSRLIAKITEMIAATLREQLKTLPKTTISIGEKPAKIKTPSVLILSPEFTVEESSLSGSEPERKETHEEKFNGDGRISEFTLSQKPVRPVSVEYPPGETRRDLDDYSVDYSDNKVKFRIPPEKGKANIVIRYTGARSSAELRSLRLNLKYLIEVSGEGETQRDEMTLDVLRSLIVAKELLEEEGVGFRVLGGRNDDSDHAGSDSTAYKTKKIECLAETKLRVDMPTSVMEEILIEKKDALNSTQV